MSAFDRAECCHELAEECRRLSRICRSAEMQIHYSRMSEHYNTLADAELLGGLAYEPLLTEDEEVGGLAVETLAPSCPNYQPSTIRTYSPPLLDRVRRGPAAGRARSESSTRS
jgi:hypothetical protein